MEKEWRAFRRDAGLTPVKGEGKEGRLDGRAGSVGQLPERFGWADQAIIERTAPSQEPPATRVGLPWSPTMSVKGQEQPREAGLLVPHGPHSRSLSRAFLWQP